MFSLIATIRTFQQPVGWAQRRAAHKESRTGSASYQGDEREEGAACQAASVRVWSPSCVITFQSRRLDQQQVSLWHQMRFCIQDNGMRSTHSSLKKEKKDVIGQTLQAVTFEIV